MLAAENLTRRFAHRDSIRVLQRAFELVPMLPASARIELEIQILERVGDAHYALGGMAESAQAYETAAERASQAGLKAAQVSALSCLASPTAFSDPERGIAVCEQAVQVSMSHDDPALLLRTQTQAACYRLLYDAWRREDADLCAAASPIGSGIPAYYEMLQVYVQAMQGDYENALANAEAGLRQMEETTSPTVYLLALGAKVVALLHLGRWGEVLRIVRAGRETAEKNGDDPWIFIFREAWLRTLALDFEGVQRLSQISMGANAEQLAVQPRALAMLATGYAALDRERYDEALQAFSKVRDSSITPKFFLHWYWRMHAQLGSSRAWLKARDLVNARREADHFLQSALSTADPNLRILAWELKAQVAMAENDWDGAETSIQKALVVLEKFAVPMAAWRVHATACEYYRRMKNDETAEKHRTRAEALIRLLANSFDEGEPLRESLLAADPGIVTTLGFDGCL
jgi:tetratricopeptide (TPR) repeat protein